MKRGEEEPDDEGEEGEEEALRGWRPLFLLQDGDDSQRKRWRGGR